MQNKDNNGNGFWRTASILGSIVVAVPSVGGLFWQVFSLASEAQSHKAKIERLEIQVSTLQSELAGNESTLKGVDKDLNEVETQFCAQDIVRNLMHANDLRMFSMLYDKVGMKLPTDNSYYPTICNRRIVK